MVGSRGNFLPLPAGERDGVRGVGHSSSIETPSPVSLREPTFPRRGEGKRVRRSRDARKSTSPLMGRCSDHSVTRLRPRTSYHLDQAQGVGGCGALLVVVEITKHLATSPTATPDETRPVAQGRVGIMIAIMPARAMPADINVVCRDLPGRRRVVMT